MPQYDRHKDRNVYIEFIATEDFKDFPYSERLTLTFVTTGSIHGVLNNRPFHILAPGILCLSEKDEIKITQKEKVSAQSFCFHPDFFNTVRNSDTQDGIATNLRIQTGLSLFCRDGRHTGIPVVSEKAYPHLFEWFFILGAEVYAQSDGLWVCRIKRYLIQILGMLEELNRQSEQSPVDEVLDYIYTNYPDKITLQELTNCAHLNRVSLNKLFQERCGCTAMNYLLTYRLKIAGYLLIHTDMSLNEIARSTGFEYDTYFIKQFTLKRGISPTLYRNASREHALLL